MRGSIFKKSKKLKRTKGDVIFDTFNTCFLVLCALLVLYPLYLIIIASISDPHAVLRGDVMLLPYDFSLIGYERLLNNRLIWISYRNSIVYTSVGTMLSLALTLMAGYAMSRQFVGRRFMNLYFIFVMFFSGGLVPTFLLVNSLGLYDNPLVMILLGAVSVWNVMIARTFIKNSIPEDLFEASSIDGCNHFKYFFMIVIPLSKALIGVLAVFYAVWRWNDFMTGMIYLRTRELFPFQLVLREILTVLQATATMEEIVGESLINIDAMRVAESVKYSAIVISTLPMLILYLFLQKYFVKGVMIGSLKG